jgi:hypothetical protein
LRARSTLASAARDHAGLINDEQVTGERMLYRSAENAVARVGLPQAMDGLACEPVIWSAVRKPIPRMLNAS